MNRETLASYAARYSGSWNLIRRAVLTHEKPAAVPADRNYLTILDENYPACLKELANPPWVLFYEGDINLLQQPMVTIVGSREISRYGAELTAAAANELRKRFVLVSGLARGADAIVHRCAIEQGHTIGVIGSGLATRYPQVNIPLYEEMGKKDLILSEYPLYCGVRKEHFPWRNRILAALGQALIVTSARRRSGTMLTVNEALQLNRDIYTFPYPFESTDGAGCNQLISEGAAIIYSRAQLAEIRPKLTIS